MKKNVYSLLWLLICWTSVPMFAQKMSVPAMKVAAQAASGANFEQLTFEPFSATGVLDAQAARFARGAQFLMLNPVELQQIMAQRPQALRLRLPYNGTAVEVDLVQVQVLTPDFKLETSTSNGDAVPFKEGLHYQGVLRGDVQSLAAFSFFDTEIMGLMSDARHGNRVLGKLDLKDNWSKYIFYDDSQLAEKQPIQCGVKDDEHAELILENNGLPEVPGCVRIFFETDHALFVNKGSVQNTINYVTGAFNQMAILFNTEQISVQLSQVFCWVTPDFYNTTNSGTALNQFRTFRTSFNADLAHLVVIGGQNTGGVAYLSAICTTNKYAYSDINTTFNNVPTYSWTIMVLTHETGHNMSSRHTHWCGWTGGAIDNCYTPEGSCQPGPPPVNGGTIMSYCHLTANGINLANGFGPQPGNAIRNFVSSRTCLAANCTPFSTCNPPLNISVANITGNSAQITWGAVTGATSYTLTYRPVGNGAWTTVNNATSPTTVTNLPANDEIEVTIRTNCGTANSGYRTGVIFKTGAATSCGVPTNLAMSNITSNSATASWTAVAGATAYEISWKLNSATAWGAAVTVTTTSHNITGLTASTAYNVRVRAVCGSTTSAYATVNFSTIAQPACVAPSNLSAVATSSTAANVTWSAVTGAVSYQISWKLSSATTWGALTTVSGTNFTINGLAANTSYDVRVRTNCSSTNSTYVQTSFTTPSNCLAPNSFSVSAGSQTTGNATWSAATGAANYRISWKLSSASAWGSEVTVTGTSYTITGLTAATTYNVRVRTSCTNGSFSGYVETTFTTQSAAGCGAPMNFYCDPITPNQALAVWTSVPGATSYQISRKLTTVNGWTGTTTTTVSSLMLTGLQAGAAYDVRVRANCNGTWSAYSFTQVFMPSNANDPSTEDRNESSHHLNWSEILTQSIQISPNPTDGWAVLSLDLPAAENIEVLIFDAFGKQLQRQVGNVEAGAFQIDLTAAPQGVYFVRVSTEHGGQAVRRVVKN